LIKTELFNDPKERSENVMIVDLVRNDLSKIAKKDSVVVNELCGIYTFPQVHQMISTVSGEVKKEVDFDAILKATFPMGSMTGAPKLRAMKLIEKYEKTKRGLYSGTVGYINDKGDFDFSVVIRSIAFNSKNNYLSFMVGGAITNQSDPEKEYDECLLKAKAMLEVLSE
jgi:para-aminobenzoate synthetase component 1